MPSYKGHALGACAMIGLVFIFSLVTKTFSAMFFYDALLVSVGSLFPDVDTASRGRRLFALLFFGAALTSYLSGNVFSTLFFLSVLLLMVLVHHRSLFHSLWFVCFLTACTVVIASLSFPGYAIYFVRGGSFFLLGVWSHLVLDRGFLQSLR